MNWFFRPNSIIDETSATTKKRKLLSLGLTFLLVYFVSTFISGMILAIPMYYLVFTDERFISFVTESANATDFDAYTEGTEALINAIVQDNASFINLCSLFGTIATIITVIFYCVKIEKRRLFTLGFVKKGAVTEYLAGFAIGGAMFSTIYGIMLLSGEAKFVGFNADVSVEMVLLFLLGFIIQGASEEILLRSYFFVTTAANTNVLFAIISSSALFGALHIGNPGFSLLAFINLFLFGVFAALYFLRRGSIWGICAIHTVWNFAQGNVFGCNVSGMPLDDTLFITEMKNGIVWSGGAFGPEGGVAVTLVLTVGIAILTFMKNKEIDSFFIQKGEFKTDPIYYA